MSWLPLFLSLSSYKQDYILTHPEFETFQKRDSLMGVGPDVYSYRGLHPYRNGARSYLPVKDLTSLYMQRNFIVLISKYCHPSNPTITKINVIRRFMVSLELRKRI